MSLPSGQYQIISQVGDRLIGRRPNEDRSLLPKKVVVLPKDFDRPRIWQIDQLTDGKYQLRTGGPGDVVGKRPDNLVWAFLREQDIEGAEWTLTHVPQHGENAIETADESNGDGWVVTEEDNSQVAVKLLVVAPSEPPVFPLNEVFNIVPVADSQA